MHLHTRNVHTAFQTLVSLFSGGETAYHIRNQDRIKIEADIVKRPSRNGNVLMIDEPVTVTYSHPRERVLLNTARDCNPFFHMYEALWMLAGREDVASLAYYNSKMKEFSDDGKTLNGAYGYRWRHATAFDYQNCRPHHVEKDVDQLDILVKHLKADPTSRRAVLQMWNVENDLLKISSGATGEVADGFLVSDKPGFHPVTVKASKDVCCNLSVMFSLRAEPDGNRTGTGPGHMLDMTVTNRSNDMIWGMLGANYVHFTFLQEYMAAKLGVEVGKYHHFTNNLHVYDWNWKPEEWLGAHKEYPKVWMCNSTPLVRAPEVFDKELSKFVEMYSTRVSHANLWFDWEEPFFRYVARPMLNVFHLYKEDKNVNPAGWLAQIQCPYWQQAAADWISNRRNAKLDPKP